MNKTKVIKNIRSQSDAAPDAFFTDQYPTLAFHKATGTNKKNIVIILLESHGAQFVKTLGGERFITQYRQAESARLGIYKFIRNRNPFCSGNRSRYFRISSDTGPFNR
jgi:hypothetical protein